LLHHQRGQRFAEKCNDDAMVIVAGAEPRVPIVTGQAREQGMVDAGVFNRVLMGCIRAFVARGYGHTSRFFTFSL